MTFDCPDSNVSVTRRNVSNTPIMALATLQNTVFHEAARAFANRILSARELSTAESRIRRAYRICLAREPSARERVVLLDLLGNYRNHYQHHPDEAEALAGPFIADGSSATETAAWIGVLRIITNLDEFVTCQ